MFEREKTCTKSILSMEISAFQHIFQSYSGAHKAETRKNK